MSKLPKTARAALAPQPAASGPYTFAPATLLHLAALDRLGVQLDGRIGASAATSAGFVLGMDGPELRAHMRLSDDELQAAAFDWADAQRPADLPHLVKAVVGSIDAAFSTFVPGAAPDPRTGLSQTSAG
jgi:hypothetical protein